MARTDARALVDLDEAIERCRQFRRIGADITFLEAPLDAGEMRRYCREVEGPKMANLIEGGKTPLLSHEELAAIGYTIAVYPLSLLNVSIRAMREALTNLAAGRPSGAMDFEALQECRGLSGLLRRRGEVRPGRSRAAAGLARISRVRTACSSPNPFFSSSSCRCCWRCTSRLAGLPQRRCCWPRA